MLEQAVEVALLSSEIRRASGNGFTVFIAKVCLLNGKGNIFLGRKTDARLGHTEKLLAEFVFKLRTEGALAKSHGNFLEQGHKQGIALSYFLDFLFVKLVPTIKIKSS
jgi:hypothetical protein